MCSFTASHTRLHVSTTAIPLLAADADAEAEAAAAAEEEEKDEEVLRLVSAGAV